MRRFARFGTISTILKKMKNTYATSCNFTESNILPWVLFTFFELYEWYQIVKSIKYKKKIKMLKQNIWHVDIYKLLQWREKFIVISAGSRNFVKCRRNYFKNDKETSSLSTKFLCSSKKFLIFVSLGKFFINRLLSKKKHALCTAQKMKFSIKYFFSTCDQIRSFLRIWSHLLQKSSMENFIFCAVMLRLCSWVGVS